MSAPSALDHKAAREEFGRSLARLLAGWYRRELERAEPEHGALNNNCCDASSGGPPGEHEEAAQSRQD